jgi:hypothetical protein
MSIHISVAVPAHYVIGFFALQKGLLLGMTDGCQKYEGERLKRRLCRRFSLSLYPHNE